MPGLDLSLVIAFAALILSVSSPIISSVINGYYRIKEKKLELEDSIKRRNQEFYLDHRAVVIECYIKATGQIINNMSRENLSEFGATMGEIYLYIDESLWPILDSISDKIIKAQYKEASDDLIKLCKALSFAQIRAEYQPKPDNPNKT